MIEVLRRRRAWVGGPAVVLSCAGLLFVATGCACGDEQGAAPTENDDVATTDVSSRDPDADEPPPNTGTGGGASSEVDPDLRLDPPPENGRDPVVPGISPIAGRCSENSDCVPGLGCVDVLGMSTNAVHYVAGGYCSVACVGDGDCASFGARSICFRALFGAPLGFCLSTCEVGAPEGEKCGGRTDLLCSGIPGAPGYCAVACATDADCGGFDRCDLGNGYCRRALGPESPLSPVGSLCLPDEPVTCNGFCFRDPGETGVCTGRCRLGSGCGAGNACVPADPNYRIGDFGLCQLGCTTSDDCVEGVTVCAPTGFTSLPGEPPRSCVEGPARESIPNRSLSVEQMSLAAIPAGAITVRSFGSGDTVHRLSASEAGVCVTGTFDAVASSVVLIYQFGTNDGVPFDASAFDAVLLDYAGPASMLVQGQLTSRPGLFYNDELEGVSFARGPGQLRVPFDRFAGEAGDPAWDPAQIEAIRLTIIGDPFEPFEACVSSLGFGD